MCHTVLCQISWEACCFRLCNFSTFLYMTLCNCYRYVNKVMVQDLKTGQKWQFLCSSWLAIDLGECTLDKVFPVATEMDLKRFRYVAVR